MLWKMYFAPNCESAVVRRRGKDRRGSDEHKSQFESASKAYPHLSYSGTQAFRGFSSPKASENNNALRNCVRKQAVELGDAGLNSSEGY